ncbi:DUF3284 domain-containing protein [Enterococcus timonensis]|uniref:DUF3284 domain-containing protein n=1 Tax=Enterococcus timonensis TaxID=1852364 RepID=UPI0008DA1886|nr:DUF3284 domain-containing protein [Enterococcus timonensis]
MEIHQNLNVPATFFFDKIADSAIYDVERHTGKRITRKQLQNIEYVKEFNKRARAKITIDKFIDNAVYGFTTSTTKNRFYVEYRIEPLDSRSCAVVYEEKMESFGFIQKINDVTVGILWGFLRKRRFKSMLKQIEATY